ncbi:MAG TPA: ABC transporter ATP-binding protein [Caulobacteraceae bacterium]
MTALLTIEGLGVALGRRTVLDGIDLSLDRGRLVAVCGPNGAGKSTLVRAALGLVDSQAGAVRVAGRAPTAMTPAERGQALGYLPQERTLAWGMAAVEVVSLGAVEAPPGQTRARALAALAEVGLSDLADRGVFEMSGGERARVLLARFLASRAALLVADEPVAGLDPDAQLMTLDLLRARADAGAGVIVTLHDLGLAARYADEVVVLARGRVVRRGPPLDALSPDILREVFGVSGAWVEGPSGPLLATRRL